MHQMRISTNEVSSVVLRPKKLDKLKYEQCLTPHLCIWDNVSVRRYTCHMNINVHRAKKQFVSPVLNKCNTSERTEDRLRVTL
jgi:hypothetical protein